MIPQKLRLHNFMCYREEQSLDFAGIHLACLTGDNGHGKSTLLDAITWALWGKARARRDDELISLGETDMWVEFEFDLGGQRYRVWRQRSKKGRGQSDLHFYIRNPADETWQLLDEGGMLERQAQIIRALRMEYDTFVNSAFLLQGRADSFTVKTASERKQILADILDLSRYDRYEERAKEEAQLRKDLAARTAGEIESIDRDLGRRAEHEARLAVAQVAVAAAAQALRIAEAQRARYRLAAQERQAQARQLADLRIRLARAERDLADVLQQLSTVRNRLKQFETVLEEKAEIEAGWAALQAAREAEAGWNARLLRHSKLQESVSRAVLAVSHGRLELEAEQRRLAGRQRELEGRVTAGEQQAAILAQAQEVLAHLAVCEARREVIAGELLEIAELSAACRAESERVKSEGQAAREKAEILAQSAEAQCPLCGQPLDAGRREQMLAGLAAEREALLSRYSACHADLAGLVGRKTAMEREDAELALELKKRDARQRQAAQAEAAINDAMFAAEERTAIAPQLAGIAARLATEDYAPDAHAAMLRIKAELETIGYDGAAHAGGRSRLEELEIYDTRYQRQLLPAYDGIADARAAEASAAAQAARRRAELDADRVTESELTAAVADLTELETALKAAVAAYDGTAEAERRARQGEGAAMQQLNALVTLAQRRVQRAGELDALNAEIGVCTQLREAFGKKGLQAMIIESAIPEVEAEANRLLARMSEGRMSLRLETQREKVTGGVAETLDIIISDELGARAYEMFSGGESFRANLALRIAISRLLARRSGTQLQTLVIDEGFGTQDAQGRQLLVEAIYSIQRDFERIIVITHIEELKDRFPVRIDVLKGENGSHVTVG